MQRQQEISTQIPPLHKDGTDETDLGAGEGSSVRSGLKRDPVSILCILGSPTNRIARNALEVLDSSRNDRTFKIRSRRRPQAVERREQDLGTKTALVAYARIELEDQAARALLRGSEGDEVPREVELLFLLAAHIRNPPLLEQSGDIALEAIRVDVEAGRKV